MEKFNIETNAITLVALVITVVILLILAGITISSLTGENGLFARAREASIDTNKSSACEQIKLAIMASYEETVLNLEDLNQNLKNIQGLTYKDKIIDENNRIDSLPILLKVKNFEFCINGNGQIFNVITIEEAQEDEMLNKEENSVLKDEYGNIIIIPAGFKIRVDKTTNFASNATDGIVIEDSDVTEDGNNNLRGNQFVWIPVGKISRNNNLDDNTNIKLSRYEFSDGTNNFVDDERKYYRKGYTN